MLANLHYVKSHEIGGFSVVGFQVPSCFVVINVLLQEPKYFG
jgi:hypothetical protein